MAGASPQRHAAWPMLSPFLTMLGGGRLLSWLVPSGRGGSDPLVSLIAHCFCFASRDRHLDVLLQLDELGTASNVSVSGEPEREGSEAQVFPVWLPNLKVSAGISLCTAEVQKVPTYIDIGKKSNVCESSVFLGVKETATVLRVQLSP